MKQINALPDSRATFFLPRLKQFNDLPVYITSIGINYEESEIVRPNGFPEHQWLQCKAGRGTFHYKGKEISVGEKQGLFIKKGEPHAYTAQQKPWMTHWITFDGYGIESILKQCQLFQTGIYEVENDAAVYAQIQQIMVLAEQRGPLSAVKLSSALFAFLAVLAESVRPSEQTSVKHRYRQLVPVLLYLDEHYNEVVTLEQLAACIGITPQYLCILFKKFFGKRPIEYLNHLRINKSKPLLMHRLDLSIAEIGREVGFENPSYFGKRFRELEGMSAGAFRDLFIT